MCRIPISGLTWSLLISRVYSNNSTPIHSVLLHVLKCGGVGKILTLFFNKPLGPMTLSKICFPTWASTALSGSSKRYISALKYTALAMLTRCFWPPLKVIPYEHTTEILKDIYRIKYTLLQFIFLMLHLLFSPKVRECW